MTSPALNPIAREFIKEVCTDPKVDDPRLIYADWLDENADRLDETGWHDLAEFIRSDERVPARSGKIVFLWGLQHIQKSLCKRESPPTLLNTRHSENPYPQGPRIKSHPNYYEEVDRVKERCVGFEAVSPRRTQGGYAWLLLPSLSCAASLA